MIQRKYLNNIFYLNIIANPSSLENYSPFTYIAD